MNNAQAIITKNVSQYEIKILKSDVVYWGGVQYVNNQIMRFVEIEITDSSSASVYVDPLTVVTDGAVSSAWSSTALFDGVIPDGPRWQDNTATPVVGEVTATLYTSETELNFRFKLMHDKQSSNIVSNMLKDIAILLY